MRRMKSKDQFLNIVGTWGGETEDNVIEYLKANDYVFKVQRGSKGRSPKWGDDELDAAQEKQVRLVILGDGLYEQWSAEPGMVLVIGEGKDATMNFYDPKGLEEHFEDVA